MAKKIKKVKKVATTDNRSVNRERAMSLRDIMNHPGWTILTEIWDDNIEVLQEQILTKVNADTKEVLSDLQVDRLRDKLGYLKEIIATPSSYAIMLEGNGNTEKKSFDPYDQGKGS